MPQADRANECQDRARRFGDDVEQPAGKPCARRRRRRAAKLQLDEIIGLAVVRIRSTLSQIGYEL